MIKQQTTQKLENITASFAAAKGLREKINFSVEVPPKNIDADFAVNAAMVIAKKIKTNPRVVAQELIDIISKEMPEIEKSEIAGAGFINLTLKNEVLYKELTKILNEKDNYASQPAKNKEKVMVEFVSANPTGPLHIGHGRGAAIGDSLAKVLKRLGYDVKKEYYLNDVGNQMLVLAESTQIRYQQLKGNDIPFPPDHYQGDYIKDIAARLIKEGKPESEINFKEEAVKDILKTIEDDLKDFAVTFDNWFSEGLIAAKKDKDGKTEVDKACEFLLSKDDAYVKDEALWLASAKFGDDKDRVLKRSDGRYTYLASDVAYHKNKFERGFTKLVNLWGADHHGYVARINASVQMLGFAQSALKVILYQLVSLVRGGQPVTMSTRTGEFITLKEVVDEVGKDACRFFFLLRAPDSQLDFDLELAKKQSSENPVFYVQYVNARCNSIFTESKKRADINLNPDLSLLKEKQERDLIKKLSAFGDTLALCEKTFSPHHFTQYLIELADNYHKFYEKCRVLSDDSALTSARLKLLEAVVIIIKNGLDILGVSSPEKM
ncbi:arginine--tRNA ligase [Endomicrobium proavitum]|uniref:Arginine--tRNA ligase n=1 Tax=Endomicrobium proavitum TaxID=1408281 RepID=A0A0G3WKI4_9BACT|nr:arginine--tRNA ligase [Endomicrobium proavitum]AKL98397.1 Arginine--tRNA ligase [Endomicrobium proavitum]